MNFNEFIQKTYKIKATNWGYRRNRSRTRASKMENSDCRVIHGIKKK